MTPRIRIDTDAGKRLEKAAEEIGATKSGLASELIRRGVEDMFQDLDGPDLE